jgi:hypothetical protein
VQRVVEQRGGVVERGRIDAQTQRFDFVEAPCASATTSPPSSASSAACCATINCEASASTLRVISTLLRT